MTDTKQAIAQLTELKAEFAVAAKTFEKSDWLRNQYGHYHQDDIQSAIDKISAANMGSARAVLNGLKKTLDIRVSCNENSMDIIGLLQGIVPSEVARASKNHSKKVGAVLKLI